MTGRLKGIMDAIYAASKDAAAEYGTDLAGGANIAGESPLLLLSKQGLQMPGVQGRSGTSPPPLGWHCARSRASL